MFLGLPIILYIGAAAWRLANLLANEDGPFHMFKTLRSRIARAEVRSRRKNGLLSRMHLYEGINCEYCNSIWFGATLTLGYALLNETFLYLILPLAISTVAVVIKHVVFLLKSVDTRYDQQNQEYLAWKEAVRKSQTSSTVTGTPEWDALVFEQNLLERR